MSKIPNKYEDLFVYVAGEAQKQIVENDELNTEFVFDCIRKRFVKTERVTVNLFSEKYQGYFPCFLDYLQLPDASLIKGVRVKLQDPVWKVQAHPYKFYANVLIIAKTLVLV